MSRKIIVVNELVLGNRNLGFEALALPKGEVVEFTTKQLKDLITSGKEEVFGLTVSEETGELIPDESFYCSNYMVKSHINSLVPKFESNSLVNLFYVVIGSRKEKGNVLYDVVSSRYERASVTEEKIKTLLDMGVISAGVKLENGELIVAPMEKSKTEKKEEVAP